MNAMVVMEVYTGLRRIYANIIPVNLYCVQQVIQMDSMATKYNDSSYCR